MNKKSNKYGSNTDNIYNLNLCMYVDAVKHHDNPTLRKYLSSTTLLSPGIQNDIKLYDINNLKNIAYAISFAETLKGCRIENGEIVKGRSIDASDITVLLNVTDNIEKLLEGYNHHVQVLNGSKPQSIIRLVPRLFDEKENYFMRIIEPTLVDLETLKEYNGRRLKEVEKRFYANSDHLTN